MPESLSAQSDLLDLARLLLTPGARMSDADDGSPRSMIEWEKARIRWHRLDGNDALADELLRHRNAVNRALGKDEVDA